MLFYNLCFLRYILGFCIDYFIVTNIWCLRAIDACATCLVIQNLSQLASINYDLLTKGWKDDASTNRNAWQVGYRLIQFLQLMNAKASFGGRKKSSSCITCKCMIWVIYFYHFTSFCLINSDWYLFTCRYRGSLKDSLNYHKTCCVTQVGKTAQSRGCSQTHIFVYVWKKGFPTKVFYRFSYPCFVFVFFFPFFRFLESLKKVSSLVREA